MRVPSSLFSNVDYGAVVRAELGFRNRYLPPRVADRALLAQADEVAQWLRVALGREFAPLPQDIVLARKFGGGSRPLPFTGLLDRLAYRVLVGLIRPGEDGARGDHAAFRHSPLEVEEEDCKYVLKTDVAAYYQYIDHERLVDEVVAQTGDDVAIVSVIELLQLSSGRRFGLPQMSQPSDVMADVYIDPIRRDLVRAGYTVMRFADDFRVPCKDYRSALAALELVERSAFGLGLVLNESKTSTPKRETYAESLEEMTVAEQELFALLDGKPTTPVDLTVLSIEDFFNITLEDYDDDDVEDDSSLGNFAGDPDDESDDPATDDVDAPSERQLEAARLVLRLWEENRLGTPGLTSGLAWGRATWSLLLRKTLAMLTLAKDDSATGQVPSLLIYEPDLTPQVCKYLSGLAASEPATVSVVLDLVCASQAVSAWQSLWVAYCASSLPPSGLHQDASHVGWLRQRLADSHGSVAAQAALTLAQRRLLSAAEAAETYRRVPLVHRLTAFLALAAAHGQAQTVVPTDDRLEVLLASWVGGQSWGGSLTSPTQGVAH